MAGVTALLFSLLLHAMLLVAAEGDTPPCGTVAIKLRMSWSTVRQGRRALLKVKVMNEGPDPISGLGVGIALPGALVPSPKSSPKPVATGWGSKSISGGWGTTPISKPCTDPIVVDDGSRGGRAAYWINMYLPARKHRKLELRLRACGSAPARRYALNGTVYVINAATNDVACLSRTAAPAMVRQHLNTLMNEHGTRNSDEALAPCSNNKRSG